MGLFVFGMATPLALAKLSRYQVVLLSLELVSPLPSFLHCEFCKVPGMSKQKTERTTTYCIWFLFFITGQLLVLGQNLEGNQPANGSGDSWLGPVTGGQASYFAPFPHGCPLSSLSPRGSGNSGTAPPFPFGDFEIHLSLSVSQPFHPSPPFQKIWPSPTDSFVQSQ